jgi:heme A synthase
VIALIVLALRRRTSPGIVRAARLLAALLVVQIALGAANVWLTHEYEALILAHLATATLLWGTLATLTLQLFRIPAPATEQSVQPKPQTRAATA